MRVLDMLNDIGKTRGSKAKMAKLDTYGTKYPVLKQVLFYALDPNKVYRVKKLPNEIDLMDMGPGQAEKATIGFPFLDELTRLRGIDGLTRIRVDNHIKHIHPEERVVFCRILKKDLRIGVDASTVNKVWKDFIPTYECGLAQTFNPKKATWPMFIEVKYDGERCQVFITGDDVYISSRNGKEILGYDHIREQVLRLPQTLRDSGIVLDGELMFGMFGKNARKKNEKTADLICYDMLTLEEWHAKECRRKFMDRRGWLMSNVGNLDPKNAPNIRTSHGIICYTINDAMAFYDRVLADGGEGIMLKLMDAFYHFKRGYHWMKFKPFEDADVRIVGVVEGTGKYVGCLGALIVDFNGVLVNVGSGFSDEQRLDMWLDYEKKQSKLIGRMVEVRYTEKTPDGSMRFPRFRKMRPDKE